MKKTFFAFAVVAAMANVSAHALTSSSDEVKIPVGSFENFEIGSFQFSGLSNVSISLWFIESGIKKVGGVPQTVNYSAVTFDGGTLGGLVPTNWNPSTNTFSFSNLAGGTYSVKASGIVFPGDGARVGFDSTVTAVPEPESLAMFLAGLGIMGAVARRRRIRK